MPAGGDTVRRLLEALDRHDEEAVRAHLHPDVVAVGQRGPRHGPDEVVAWAKPSREGHLVSSVTVDEVREVSPDWVAVGARRLWRWTETGEDADEQGFGVLFGIRDGAVVSWDQRFASIVDAVEAVPA